MSAPKIKEKPPVTEAIKEKTASVPKELVRRGTAASASKLTEQVKEAAQPTPTAEEQPETASVKMPVTAVQRAGQQVAQQIYAAKKSKIKEWTSNDTVEPAPDEARSSASPAERKNWVKGGDIRGEAQLDGGETPTLADKPEVLPFSNERRQRDNQEQTKPASPRFRSEQAPTTPPIAKSKMAQFHAKPSGQMQPAASSNGLKADRRMVPKSNQDYPPQIPAESKSIKTKIHTPKESNKAAKSVAHRKNSSIKSVNKNAKDVRHTEASVNATPRPRIVPTKATKHKYAAEKGTAKAAEATKRIAAAVKNLGAVLGAGGGVAAAITLVIVLAAGLLCSPLGIFFSGETEGNLTLQQVMSQLNTEFSDKISEIESTVPHDEVEQTGQRALWKEVLTIYAVKTTTETALDAASMDEAHAEVLREIFWDMNQIDYATETYTEEVPVETPAEDSTAEGTDATEFVEKTRLVITITAKNAEEMAAEYGFDQEQLGYVAELLSDEYVELWSMLSVGGGSDDIVAVAQSQLGNAGGQPYWSWYGFSSRVSWCACFVSWCGDQCGYIEAGAFPRFSYCDTGIAWFRAQGQWQDGGYVPSPGNIIFFDWDGNGISDHVGIVESCDGATVYTIEGNANDTVERLSYAVGDGRIMGYGIFGTQ